MTKKNPAATATAELLKERGASYGRFTETAEVIQQLKGVIYAELAFRDKRLDPDQQEALDMICHKIGRIINGNPDLIDSWQDIAGYAELVVQRLSGELL